MQADIGGSTGWESKQRKANNGVDDKYHIIDGNAIRRPRETGSRSGAMESHDSQQVFFEKTAPDDDENKKLGTVNHGCWFRSAHTRPRCNLCRTENADIHDNNEQSRDVLPAPSA